jgi:exodeoxyribonuclease-3
MQEEIDGMNAYTASGFEDTFRKSNTDGEHYSWWSYRGGARERNVGWRIDYFLVSSSLVNRIESAFILSSVHGSDHCPVGLILK